MVQTHSTPSLRHPFSAAGLALVLFLAQPREGAAESSLQYKYQDYGEDNGRIAVKAHYALAAVDVGTATQLRARGVLDTITGATPTGQPAPVGSTQVPLSGLEDERRAVIADVAHTLPGGTVRFEYAYSDEDDYLSRGYSVTVGRDFNQKNTEVQFGFSYVDDDIQPVFFSTARRKLSRDFLLGVTQLLDPQTTLTANLSYGTSDGYLSDPYKIVRKTTVIIGNLTLPLTFPENRPDRREKAIFYTEFKRYFESARGSVEASYRYLDDDHGVESDTLELAWFQRLGDRWILNPLLRFYRQNRADYYFYDLDFTSIVPTTAPGAGGPFYSSDYRLSAFDATTWGLKVVYAADDRWSVDFSYERYRMQGRDGVTPSSAYASADIFTVGAKLWY